MRFSVWFRINGFSGLVVALALVACTSCAGPGAQVDSRATAGTFELIRGKALLWEVSRPGSAAVSAYLLGSVHLFDQPLSLGPEIEKAFSDAEVLVVEVDLRDLEQEDIQELLIRYGMLTWGEKLDDFLSAEALALLNTYLDKQELAPELRMSITRMRPWLIATMLAELSAESDGYQAALGIDRFFLDLAGEKTVIGLETMDEQFFLLSSHSDRIQEMMLRQSIKEIGLGVEVAELVEAWKMGDEATLADIIFSGEGKEIEEFNETLLIARNELMAESLIEWLKEGPDDVYFVVVGSGHLVGDDSIPSMLRAGGFRVERTKAR